MEFHRKGSYQVVGAGWKRDVAELIQNEGEGDEVQVLPHSVVFAVIALNPGCCFLNFSF